MAPGGGGGFRLYPSTIKFTQDSIKTQFMDGRELSSTMEELLYGRKTVDDIPAIEVVDDIEDDDGGWWALTGNRRLYLYRKLEQLGVVETIPVIKLNCWEYGVSERLSQRRTTLCNGRDIRLRGGQGEWRINQMIDRWRGSRSFIQMPKKQQPDVMNSVQATIQIPTPKKESEPISVNKSPEEEVPLKQFTSNQCTAAASKESVAYTIDEENNWEEETAEDAALMLLRRRIVYSQMKDNDCNCNCKCILIVIFICLLFAVVAVVVLGYCLLSIITKSSKYM